MSSIEIAIQSKSLPLLREHLNVNETKLQLNEEQKQIMCWRFAGKKVKHLETQDLGVFVKEAIAAAYVDTNQNIPDDVVHIEGKEIKQFDYQCKTLLIDVRKSFKELTGPEVVFAIKQGVREVYGKYFGLNNVTYFKFLVEYRKSKDRIEALDKLAKILAPKTETAPQLSHEQMYDSMRNIVIQMQLTIENEDSGGMVVTYPLRLIYDFLVACKLYLPSDETKQTAFEKAYSKFVAKIKLTPALTEKQKEDKQKLIEATKLLTKRNYDHAVSQIKLCEKRILANRKDQVFIEQCKKVVADWETIIDMSKSLLVRAFYLEYSEMNISISEIFTEVSKENYIKFKQNIY